MLELIRFDWSFLKDFITVSMPVMISGVMWGIAQAAQTTILSHIGVSVIATNSVAIVVFQIFVAFGFSTANASSIIIGNTVGRGQTDLVKTYTRTFQIIFIIIFKYF